MLGRSLPPGMLRVNQRFGKLDRASSRNLMEMPWIGVIVAWGEGMDPEVAMGSFTGTRKGGVASCVAVRGSLVRWGTNRSKPCHHSQTYFGVVNADGSVSVIRRSQAWALWKEAHPLQFREAV